MLLIDNKIMIVHMPKCGGTSFCKSLVDTLEPERVFYLGYTPDGERRSVEYKEKTGLAWKHATAYELVKGLALDPGELEIILVSTRPYWERVASFYLHAKRHNSRDAQRYAWVKDMSFSEYVRSSYFYKESIPEYSCDPEGKVLVNRFVKFSELSDEYAQLCRRLGYSGMTLPHLNANRYKEKMLGDKKLGDLFSNDDWVFAKQCFKDELDLMEREDLRY